MLIYSKGLIIITSGLTSAAGGHEAIVRLMLDKARRHENIVRLMHSGVKNSKRAMAMAALSGQSIASMLPHPKQAIWDVRVALNDPILIQKPIWETSALNDLPIKLHHLTIKSFSSS